MNWILKTIDAWWNLAALKGHRTFLAQTLISGIGLYQMISTQADAIKFLHVDLPDIPATVSAPILVYLAAKVKQFSDEHK